MNEPALEKLLAWMRATKATPVDALAVPGASPTERAELAALGQLVGSAIADRVDRAAWGAALRTWAANDVAVPADVRAAARATAASEGGSEALASLYESIVSSRSRRALGTFFTDPAVVTSVLDDWDAVGDDPATVVDIGAGVGAFTLTAAKRWPSAVVHAVDISPVTLGLLGWLAVEHDVPLRDRDDGRPGVHLVHDDYIRWSANLAALEAPRLVLGNPPYTRSQLIPINERQRLRRLLGDSVGSRATLSTWMLARSLAVLDRTDGLALLLPSHWLEAEYASKVRSTIWSLGHRPVRMTLLGAAVFPDARVDAVSLVIGPDRGRPQSFAISGDTGETITVDRTAVCPAAFRRVTSTPTLAAEGIALNEFATSRRGIATGCNAFFLISESARQSMDLPSCVLVPTLRRLHGMPKSIAADDLNELDDGVPRWLLAASAYDRVAYAAVEKRLADGERDGVDEAVLCTRRKVWHDLRHEVVRPDVIVGPIARGRFPIVVSDRKIAITNNLYGLRWRDGVSETRRNNVVAWLRSDAGQSALQAVARSQAHGLIKLEPRALSNLRIPKWL